jgi:outer membrane lipoprotein-sorting protein
MAPIQPPQPERDFGGYAGFEGDGSDAFPRSRKVVRYGVPVAIAGVAAATIGLGTALASTGGSPSLPNITAEQLLDKIATSKVQTVSGSVQVTTDLGLPDGLLNGAVGGAAGGGGPFGQHGGKGGGATADPQAKLTELLSGTHTLRVAADGPDRQRVSIVDNTAEYTVVHNGDQMWAYDSASNSVYHQTADKGAQHGHRTHRDEQLPATPQEAVRQALKNVGPTTSVTVDGTARVAGQQAYQLLIKPKQADSTIDSIRVAVDAANGVPLRFTLTPKGGGAAAVDIGYTKVNFGKPAASTFDFSVPKGARVTEGKDNGENKGAQDHGGLSGLNVIGKDWNSIAELKSEGGQLPSGKGGQSESVQGLLGSFGHQVKGSFGSGTVINTRLVNVLITDKGAVFAGAVNQNALVKAADSAAN